MDTFRKWWNKPKADDKSILARFYYADKALTAVASELDSFDGRAEPERCSRLVGRLRQGQDQVLAITNIIMDELLGEDRAPRAFRAKFPEEVLQESLAGQLWFGAECLAAGSSIMNREAESAAMRPLAKAVTKSLDHVRNLLREQCLRNKTPNSLTLNLDLNDAVTETLCESLKIFDRLFAEFELLYVSAMVQVKTKQEHEMQELICVLFSETLQRALRLGLLEQEQVDYFDPALMFSIPRLAIVAGLVIYSKGPLNMSMPADQLSEMFRPFRTLLIKIRDLLRTLNANELYQLEKLLCTNEDIHIIEPKDAESEKVATEEVAKAEISSSFNCDDTDDNDDDDDKFVESNSSSSSTGSNISRSSSSNSSTQSTSTLEIPSSNTSESDLDRHVIDNEVYCTINGDNISNRNHVIDGMAVAAVTAVAAQPIPSVLPTQINIWTNTPIDSIPSAATATMTELLVDTNIEPETSDHSNKDEEWITADCASGYLIPNTNFGNLLQTTDTPLTDSFISSDDEYAQKSEMNFANGNVNGDGSLFVTGSTSAIADNEGNLSEIQSVIENVKNCATEQDNVQTIATISGAEGEINRAGMKRMCDNGDSGIGTAENTSLDHTPDSETSKFIVSTSDNNVTVSVATNTNSSNCDPNGKSQIPIYDNSSNEPNNTNVFYQNYATSSYYHIDESTDNGLPTGPQSQRLHQKLHQSRHRSHSQHGKHHRDKCEKGCTRKHQSHGGNHSNSKSAAVATHSRRRSSRYTSSRGTDEKVSFSSTSCIYSQGDTQEISRHSSRLRFKSTENLLHRLFVCIAGVADQLQTNFASDLRQILRSVFLMNTSPSAEEVEINIAEKSKDSTSDLFEFRASENDVIQENDNGSNQSIYSAEEANPDLDSVFDQSIVNQTPPIATTADRQERSASLETEIRITTNRMNVERSRSLGEDNNSRPVSVVVTTTNNCRHQCIESTGNNGENINSPNDHTHSGLKLSRSNHRADNNGSAVVNNSNNSLPNQSQHSIDNSGTLSTTTTTIILTTNSRVHRNSLNEDVTQQQQQQRAAYQRPNHSNLTSPTSRQQQIMPEPPPRWIPDEEAAQCMACSQTFTTFRRRHHCRNCGGVFCGICSNSQAPLPKFGLNKAVRVCRNCFSLNITGNGTTHTSAANNTSATT